MRIAYDARYINDRYHGIGRYAYQLLTSLIEQAPQHTFIVFQGKAADSRFNWSKLSNLPNVELYGGPWPLYWPQEQLIWPALLKKYRADCFHSPYFVAPVLNLSFSNSIPVIITVHDLIFDRHPEYMPVGWMRPYYKMMMRFSIRRAKLIVTVSQHTARDLEDFYKPPRDKIITLPEGVDPVFELRKNGKGNSSIKEKYHLQQPYILSVGARRPHKNLGRLIAAFASLTHRIPHTLVLVGTPDHRFDDDAFKAVQTHHLTHRVRFLEWVPDEDLPTIYQLADLVVLPSLLEGFGLPALEAMASGTPVTAADNSSIPEVAGDAGSYFDPFQPQKIAQAMAEVLLDPDLQRQMRGAGLRRAAEFNWDTVARRMLSVYESLNR